MTRKVGNSSKNFTGVKAQFKALAKIDYGFYIEYAHRHLYEHGRHTELISEVLERVEAGEITRVIIELPPRHSKSMTISETFPSWFIGKQPNRRVIVSSYGESLAQKFGRLNKQKINEFGQDLFDIEISDVNASNTNWGIKGYRGGMISSGIGGAITGEGADLLIIDDPIKNRREAESKTYRDMVWNEWLNTLNTRLHPGGAVIVIMTRWHEDDFIGRLLNKDIEGSDPESWTRIRIPCEAEDDDILGREPGEPLWPERGFDKAWMETKKREVGSQTWASLYQQRPAPAEGKIFKRKWWKFYNLPPEEMAKNMEEQLQSWDCAFKGGDENDPVAAGVWGRKGADRFLLDRINERMDIIATMSAMRSLTAKWPRATTKLVEDKANGPAIIALLKREIPGIVPVNPEGGKIVRARAASPYIEAGNVWLPHPKYAPWVHDFIEQFSSFPNGTHDDEVDQTTQALIRLGNAPQPSIRST